MSDGPFLKVIAEADALIGMGATVFQRFTCLACKARQTMSTPNIFYTTGQFSEAIAMGDLSRRLHLGRGDEIGQLCEALDCMAEDLEKRSEMAGAIASGDLTQQSDLLSDYDVLGMSLQSLAQGLNDIIGQINQAAGRFTDRSRQVSDSSQALSQGATEQAAVTGNLV